MAVSVQRPWIDVGSDGSVWFVNESGQIFQRAVNQWVEPNPTDRAVQISVGTASLIWAVNALGQILKRAGSAWIEPDRGARAKQIAVGSDSAVWCVNATNNIYQLVGDRWQEPNPTSRATQISVGDANHIWAVGLDGRSLQRLGTYWLLPPNPLSGVTSISAAADGSVWATTQEQRIYQRQADKWVEPDKNARAVQITVGSASHIWVVNAGGSLYQLTTTGWKAVDRPVPSYLIYRVQPGDTLALIAQRYGTTTQQLMALNPFITNPNYIVVGWELRIPKGGVTPPPPPLYYATYRVQPGDTLAVIAQRYRTTVEYLISLNPFITSPDWIQVGWDLKVPIYG